MDSSEEESESSDDGLEVEVIEIDDDKESSLPARKRDEKDHIGPHSLRADDSVEGPPEASGVIAQGN